MTAESDQIKDSLRRCRTLQEVDALSKAHAAAFVAMLKQGGEAKVQAIQIKNLGAYMRAAIAGEWLDEISFVIDLGETGQPC